MTAPVSRERQIEMMRTAKERHVARAAVWKKDATLVRALTEPLPEQLAKSHYKQKPRKSG